MENQENKATVPAQAAEGQNTNKTDRRPNSGRGNHGDKRQGGRRDNRRDSRPEKLYEERVVRISRISKTVKGGRRMRFSALVVIGDGKGKYGYGTGKSTEVPEAIKKALEVAKAHMYRLPIVKGDTIPHVIVGQFGACKVFLKPAPEGTGIVAGGSVRAVLELAGVKNIYSKIYGSRTPINAIKATVNGLEQLKTYSMINKTRYGTKEVK